MYIIIDNYCKTSTLSEVQFLIVKTIIFFLLSVCLTATCTVCTCMYTCSIHFYLMKIDSLSLRLSFNQGLSIS